MRPINKVNPPPFENVNSTIRCSLLSSLSYVNFAFRFQNLSVGVFSCSSCNLTVISALPHEANEVNMKFYFKLGKYETSCVVAIRSCGFM